MPACGGVVGAFGSEEMIMPLGATDRDDEGRIGSGPGRPLFGDGIAG